MLNVKLVTPYINSLFSLVKFTVDEAKIVNDGLELRNQNEELPVDLCVIFVIPPISILLHYATSLPAL